ncbi:hypothetical protein J7443_17045 [Tropicibacter sp. R15_0]|uniref:hypothetical protein n=1 Tax=Tropicibacter sp. R15_0 TaxID=2821101 RepID=UPI001AD9B278|nr:hypothetical protein [Tropicibacter sp. R15_0]MBO9466955.1 hypothetical protein [Tropicibacter sp. R15_0]
MSLMRLALITCLPLPALADPCVDRLADILANPLFTQTPYEAQATGKIGGGETITFQQFMSDTHSLIKTITPKGLPDTLFYEGGTYQADGNGGWTLLYSTDLQQYKDGLAATRKGQSENVLSAECDNVEIDGSTYDQISGVIDIVPPYQSEWQVSYVMDPATGLPKQFTYAYTLNGMEAVSRFDYTAKPDMQLPKP